MHLDIHLHQGFLHVLDVRCRQLHKPLALAQIRAQRRDLALGKETGAQLKDPLILYDSRGFNDHTRLL